MKSLPNILIVDDSEDNLDLLETLLGETHANIILALSGFEALEKVKGIDLALAIVDVRMPEMDGFELAKRMNAKRPGNNVPIIFLTASHHMETQINQGYSSGAVDYIFKPVNNYIFLAKVNVFLDQFNQKQTILDNVAELKKSAGKLARTNKALKSSEEKFRSYIDHAPDGVFITDEKGRYLEVNKAACKITGYSKQELLKMSISEMLPSSWQEEGLEHFRRLDKTGISTSDVQFTHKNGSSGWWTVAAVKLSEKRYLGFTKDITIRKTAIDALAESEERYRSLFNSIVEGVMLIGPDGYITHANPAAEKILGVPISKIIGSRCENPPWQVISTDRTPMPREEMPGLLAMKTRIPVKNVVMGIRRPDYFVVWINVNAVPLFSENGDLKCVIETFSDITMRTNAEEELFANETRLNKTQEIAHLGTWEFDLVSNRLIWSDEVYKIFGLLPQEFTPTYDAFIQCVHPDDRQIVNETYMLSLAKGASAYKIEHRIIRKSNGEMRYVDQKCEHILDEKGFVVRSIGMIHDITEHKLAEDALKVSEEKYRTMLNASPDGIFITSLSGIITDVSEIGLELFGSDTTNDLKGKHFLRFVPHDEKKTVREIIEKTMNEGLAQNFEIKIRKKNQSLFLSETSSTLIQGQDGTPFSFMIIVRDISQRKKLEKKQIHADRMANLGEMASGIAHEINQPLNTISIVMDNILLEASKDQPTDHKYLNRKSEKIFENITRIRNIIDHVRAFSRSHDDYILTGFDVNTSIRNAASMISEQFKHLAICMNLELEENLPQIIGNTYKFEQVILNLLSNAKDAVLDKKSNQPDSFEMLIGIKSCMEGQFVTIVLTDNGAGISEEDIDHIMLPFYTTKDAGKGTGLGLSISYQIIKEMNGTIEIIQNLSEGTIFKIMLNTIKDNFNGKTRKN